MCNACGFPARPGVWTEAGLADAGDRMRARFRRAAVLRRVLQAHGLTAHDDGLTAGIQLSSLTGAHRIVGDVAGLWPAVAEMSGATFDPLDPALTGDG